VHHGVGREKRELIAHETEKLFREVDRAILQVYSRPSGLPLVLAGLLEHQALFRRLSRNPFLLHDGIDVNPGTLSPDALRERAWRIVEPRYLARLAGLVEIFGAARAREFGSDDLGAIAESAAAGRIATLLVQAEREKADIDDRLDDIAETTLGNRGQVVVVPAMRMPTRSGAAAIYRFQI
jgi:hypothetical protein